MQWQGILQCSCTLFYNVSDQQVQGCLFMNKATGIESGQYLLEGKVNDFVIQPFIVLK